MTDLTLPDGSIVYSKSVLEKFTYTRIPIGGESYKSQYHEDPQAVRFFYKYIQKIIDSGHPVYFLMTPYAPNVFKASNSESMAQLQHMEPVIRNLGISLNVPVLGSFNPTTIGCTDVEFYDHMHPKSSCLAKIQTN